MKLKLVLFFCLLSTFAYAQRTPYYRHYFLTPNVINPAYIGQDGFNQITLIQRQQWTGLSGAPVTSNLNVQLPFSGPLALGFNIANDKLGLLTSTTAQTGVAYTLGTGNNGRFSFGLGLGVGQNAIDVTQIPNPDDPALSGALDKSFYAVGQFGMNFSLGGFDLGVALPELFNRNTFSTTDFQPIGISALNTIVSSASYRFTLGPKLVFQPMVIYEKAENFEDQLEGNGTFYINETIWVGGVYKKDIGAGMHAGININEKLRFGYSYEFSTQQVSGFVDATHEFILGFKLGSNKRKQDVDEDNIEDVAYLDDQPDTEEVEIETEPNLDDEDETTLNQKEEDKPVEPSIETKVENPASVLKTEKADSTLSKDEQIQKDTTIIKNEELKTDTVANKSTSKEIQDDLIIQKPAEESKAESSIVTTDNKGSKQMVAGNYLVVGAFNIESNAIEYLSQLVSAGYSGNIGHKENDELFYIYLNRFDDPVRAHDEQANIKSIAKFQFQDAWILKVE